MQKVLLAINGMNPHQKAFSFAVQLCQRLKAELCILQVLRPSRHDACLKTIVGKCRRVMHFLEDSMTAVTFAEAGEHETAQTVMIQARKNINELLPETAKAGVLCSLTMKTGYAGKEIVRYAQNHRDIVLTVYDDGVDAPKKGANRPDGKQNVAEEIKRRLYTPIVTMNG